MWFAHACSLLRQRRHPVGARLAMKSSATPSPGGRGALRQPCSRRFDSHQWLLRKLFQTRNLFSSESRNMRQDQKLSKHFERGFFFICSPFFGHVGAIHSCVEFAEHLPRVHGHLRQLVCGCLARGGPFPQRECLEGPEFSATGGVGI